MDELALLKDFRLEDASPDGAREYARARLQSAMTPRRRLRRRYTLALAFVLAALLAAAAYAIVHAFVIGSVAPKDVQDQIGQRLAVVGSSAIPTQGPPYRLAEPAVIAAGTQSPAGPVYMLLGRIKSGGECQFVWYAAKRTPKGLPITSGACGLGQQHHARGFGYGFEYDGTSPAHPFMLIEGYVPGAVRLRIGDRFFKTPFGWFIAHWRGPELLTAYGVQGGVVARVRLRSSGTPSGGSQGPSSTGPTYPTRPRRVIISTHTGWAQTDIHIRPSGRTFKWIYKRRPLQVAIAPDNKGGRCIYAYVGLNPGDPGPGCGWHARANELHVIPDEFGWTGQKQWVSVSGLLGQAGANIAHVNVRFSDGRTAEATLREGVVFYLIPRPNYARGHRPVEVVARDASGQVVARKRLPFAN